LRGPRFCYLLSLLFHALWSRAGKGPIPPVRVPVGKGKKLPLPALSPWQLMIATWVVRRLWSFYGGHVKMRLTAHQNPVARHVGTLLPDPTADNTPAPSSAQPAPTQPTAAASQPAPTMTPPPPAPAKSYGTQKLSPGSVLSALRRPQQPST
jgi:hypothetical protein